MVFGGYYQSKTTKEAFTEDGWFCPGDLKTDKDGHLYIVGRKKMSSFCRMEKCSSEDLKLNYLKTPLVAELAVLGVKDESIGVRCGKLIAVVVPDFDYLKQAKFLTVMNQLFDFRWFGTRIARISACPRIHRPSWTIATNNTRKIKRFELFERNRKRNFATFSAAKRKNLEITEDDKIYFRLWLEKAVVATITNQKQIPETIHPEWIWNLI